MNAKHLLAQCWKIKDVAILLNCCPRTVKRHRVNGRFPRPDIEEGRFIRWLPETITRWKKQNLEKLKN